MRRLIPTMALSLLCFAVLIPAAQAERADDCVALVNKALEMFKTNGIGLTLKKIGSQDVLTDRELYVFALTLDNKMVGHPYKPSLVGKDMNSFKDVKGNYLFREFASIAKTVGSGWLAYWWERPGEKAPSFKRSYIKRVPGEEIYVGAGYYPDNTSISMK